MIWDRRYDGHPAFASVLIIVTLRVGGDRRRIAAVSSVAKPEGHSDNECPAIRRPFPEFDRRHPGILMRAGARAVMIFSARCRVDPGPSCGAPIIGVAAESAPRLAADRRRPHPARYIGTARTNQHVITVTGRFHGSGAGVFAG
jgi:hypothetical protein